jgi:hypothetical protein
MNTFGLVRTLASSIEKLDRIHARTKWTARFVVFRRWKKNVYTIANFLHLIKANHLSPEDVKEAQSKFKTRM